MSSHMRDSFASGQSIALQKTTVVNEYDEADL